MTDDPRSDADVSLHDLSRNELAGCLWSDLGFESFLRNAGTTLKDLADRLSR